jgi:hypothetical protein
MMLASKGRRPGRKSRLISSPRRLYKYPTHPAFSGRLPLNPAEHRLRKNPRLEQAPDASTSLARPRDGGASSRRALRRLPRRRHLRPAPGQLLPLVLRYVIAARPPTPPFPSSRFRWIAGSDRRVLCSTRSSVARNVPI